VPALVPRRGHGADPGRPRRGVRRVGGSGLAVAERRRGAGQGPVRGGRRGARIPRIVARWAPGSRRWSRATAARWGWRSPGPPCWRGGMVGPTMEAIVVERPEPTAEAPQNLSLDGGYDNPTGRAAAAEAKYIPHIHKGGEVVKPGERKPGSKPRRWVV